MYQAIALLSCACAFFPLLFQIRSAIIGYLSARRGRLGSEVQYFASPKHWIARALEDLTFQRSSHSCIEGVILPADLTAEFVLPDVSSCLRLVAGTYFLVLPSGALARHSQVLRLGASSAAEAPRACTPRIFLLRLRVSRSEKQFARVLGRSLVNMLIALLVVS